MRSGADFKVGDEVYFCSDPDNMPYLVTGILDRGDCIRFLVSDKAGEKEVADYEISKQITVR